MWLQVKKYTVPLMVMRNEAYGYSTGTSMAAPFVTGMAALYKQSYPDLNPTATYVPYMQKSGIGFGR